MSYEAREYLPITNLARNIKQLLEDYSIDYDNRVEISAKYARDVREYEKEGFDDQGFNISVIFDYPGEKKGEYGEANCFIWPTNENYRRGYMIDNLGPYEFEFNLGETKEEEMNRLKVKKFSLLEELKEVNAKLDKRDPVFFSEADGIDGSWFFFDEHWADTYGPFETEEQCRKSLKEYLKNL